MFRPLDRRRCLLGARLPVVFAVLGAALVLPAAASAATNPGTVELFQSSLNYTAKAGQTNHIVASFEPDQVTLTDTGANLNAGAGCHPGASVHEILCAAEDVSTGTGTSGELRYAIDAGDLDDSVDVTMPRGDVSIWVPGVLYGRAGNDTLNGGDAPDVLVGGTGADALHGGSSSDVVSYADHALGITATIGGSGGNSTDGAALDTIDADIETLAGGPGADTLAGDNGNDTLAGAGADDRHDGMGGYDTLVGDKTSLYGVTVDPSDPPATADGDDALYGGDGDDYLLGGAGADAFTGGGDEDALDYSDHGSAGVTVTVGGHGGNSTDGAGDTIAADIEVVRGSPGDDTLNGNAGPNKLDGSQGTDTLNGNDGDDALFPGFEGIFGYSVSPDTLNGGDGDDVFSALGNWEGAHDGAETFKRRRRHRPGRLPGNLSAVTVTLNNDAADDGTANEHDQIGSDVEDVTGGSGADTLTGNDEANRLHGGPGRGADVLKGGAGADRLYGGYGDGGDGGDEADRGDGADTLQGEDGDDTLFSRDNLADAVIDCGAGGADSVHPDAAPTDDPIGCESAQPGTTSNPVSVGEVAMTTTGLTYTALPGEANDVTATFSVEQVVVTDPGAVQLAAGSGCELTDPATVRCGREDMRYLSSDFKIRTQDGDDRVKVISYGNGNLDGGTGDDELIAGDGPDLIAGGPGADLLVGGGNVDTVTYDDDTAGVDATIGGSATSSEDGTGDTLSSDVENVVGGRGDDVLTGDGGANDLTGGYGADMLKGMGGKDQLQGGRWSHVSFVAANDGDDTLEGGTGSDDLSAGAGADTFSGGAGVDTVSYASDHNGSWKDYQTDTQMDAAPITVTIGAGNNDDGNAKDGPVGGRDTVGLDVENLEATNLGDTLTGSATPNRINGYAGADTINGLGGNDILRGGYDQVADTLDGGDEADTYVAEGYWDYSDENTLPDGADSFTGGAGIDKVDYSDRSVPVTVTLDGTADDGQAGENDDIRADVENITGGHDSDTLTGNDSANRLHGGYGVGSDTLDGAAGDDRIIGGYGKRSGNDEAAGDGADRLRGGSGHDTISSQDLRVDAVNWGDDFDVAYADVGEPEAPGGAATAVDELTGCEGINPSGFSQAISAGATVTSDDQAGETPGVSASDPVDVAVTSPNGGNVTVVESEATRQPASARLGLPRAAGEHHGAGGNRGRAAEARVHGRLVDRACSRGERHQGLPRRRAARRRVPDADDVLGRRLRPQSGGRRRRRRDVTLTILTAHASAWNFAVVKPVVTPPVVTPPAVTPPNPPLTLAEPIREALRLILVYVARQVRVQTAISNGGLQARYSCSKACEITADVRLTARDARRLGLPRVIGSATGRRSSRGTSRILVPLTARAERRLRRIRGSVVVKLTLKTTGSAATARTSKITLKH